MGVTMKGVAYVFLILFVKECVFDDVSAEGNSVPEFDFSNNIFDDMTYNPDTDLNTPDMIRRAGYPAEAHVVSTEDGYLLTIHRIPGNFGTSPVFLQHGLLGSSADWVVAGRGKSLAYLLADRGYDVWLGNFRGNTYSKAHTTLSPSDYKFWDFSWHEMGIYDLPAMISYVSNFKKDAVTYIGHSMGTTTFYVMASQRPDIARMTRAMFSLAPIGFMNHLKSPVRLVAPYAHDVQLIVRFLGKGEFLPQNSFIKLLAKYGCEIDTWEEDICANSLFVICGFDKAQFNHTLLPVILNHTPAGASTKSLVHYAQEIVSGKFSQYDYGGKKNLEIYNNTKPPEYDLSKIRVPIALFYADNDWLASPIDVQRLYSQLNYQIGMYRIPYSKFNHLDFIWGVDAPILVYKKLFYWMDKYKKKI